MLSFFKALYEQTNQYLVEEVAFQQQLLPFVIKKKQILISAIFPYVVDSKMKLSDSILAILMMSSVMVITVCQFNAYAPPVPLRWPYVPSRSNCHPNARMVGAKDKEEKPIERRGIVDFITKVLNGIMKIIQECNQQNERDIFEYFNTYKITSELIIWTPYLQQL